MTRLIYILLTLLFSLSGPAIGADSDFRHFSNAANSGRIASQGGAVRQFEQAADQTYYRVFSGNSPQGSWLTAVPPKSSAFAQEALTLPPGNNANLIQQVLVPKGTMLERSRAISVPEWGRLRGGAEQFELLNRIPASNFEPGVPLR